MINRLMGLTPMEPAATSHQPLAAQWAKGNDMTSPSPITIRVYLASRTRWAYRLHDGSPNQVNSGDAPLVESGPIRGRNQRPSRARALASAGVRDGRFVYVLYED